LVFSIYLLTNGSKLIKHFISTTITNKFEEIYLSPPETLKSKGKNASYLLKTQINREKIIEQIKGFVVEK